MDIQQEFRQRLCRAWEGTCVKDIYLQQLQLMSNEFSICPHHPKQNLQKYLRVSELLSKHNLHTEIYQGDIITFKL